MPAKTKSKQTTPVTSPDAMVAKLLSLTKQPLSFEIICDRLDIAPRRLTALINKAKQQGIDLDLEHGHVGFRPQKKQKTQALRMVSDKQQRATSLVGVISDTHYGSKYCMREEITKFVERAYDMGVRIILHPGDILDGDYRHSKFEVSHVGVEEQTKDLLNNLPHKKGLTYHAITGNHDETFTNASGINVGTYIESTFQAHGRNDFFSYGMRSAFFSIGNIVYHLWHPLGGGSYAVSYKLQKKISEYDPTLMPDILLVGHYHQYCHVYQQGVHGILCPTFQSPGSAFSNALSLSPALGGLVIDTTKTKTHHPLTIHQHIIASSPPTFSLRSR